MTVSKPIEEVNRILEDPETGKKVSTNITKNDIFHKFDENSRLYHKETKGIFLVAARDIVHFYQSIDLEDDSILKIIFSVDHEQVPKNDDFVRAEIDFNMFLINAISDTE